MSFNGSGDINTINVKKNNLWKKTVTCTSLAGLLAINSLPILASDSSQKSDESTVVGSNSSIYSSAFFEQYTPQNALDMIERLPGFSFNEGSSARGFGGNAGNVLIDGSRPTSKSGGLRAALVRIPADQVEQIQILRGGVSAGEAAGQSVVANIIKRKQGSSGTWTAELRRMPDGTTKPNIEATITTRLGEWDSSLNADIGGDPFYRTARIKDFNADGELSSHSDEDYKTLSHWLYVNADGSRDMAGGILTLNGRIGGDNWEADTLRNIYNDDAYNTAADKRSVLNEENRLRMVELGIDWARTHNHWKWRMMGLGTTSDTQYENHYYAKALTSGEADTSSFNQERLKTEFIIRTTVGKVSGSDFKPEFGLEVANNKLDTELVYMSNGIEQPLSNGNVVVEELRGEAFATLSYKANPALSLEGGLTAEFSQIKVSGDANQKKTFQFIKPRLSSTYTVNKDTRLILEAVHTVGQLNFNDFAASSQAEDDRTTSGNPNLEPMKKSRLAATYDWSFSQRGNVKIVAFTELREDILEHIILPSGGAGWGNAGDARFSGIFTDLSLPLDPLLPEGLIEISYKYRHSRFDDPMINDNRTISTYAPRSLTSKFRQDVTKYKFSWGLEYWGSYKDTGHLADEIHTLEGNKRIRLFVETSRFPGIKSSVKTRLEITHLNTGNYLRKRFFYEGNRGGAFEGSQIADRKRRPELKLTFTGTF